jgi:hypothetical protein
MGIVGAGFVGPHHIDAVRRLGFVDVVAIAGSSDATARAKADSLGVPKAYGSYDALLNDPDLHVVHNATPNYLHYPVNAAAIAKGKHVVSDKPLAMTAAEAKKLVDQAAKAEAARRHRSCGARNTRTSSGSAGATRPTRSCRKTPGSSTPPGILGRCLLQPDARHLSVHRRREEARRSAPAPFATFEDGFEPTASSKRFWRARRRGASGRK